MELAQDNKLADVEIQLLLEGVFQHYGWDFREYAPASLKRRIHTFLRNESIATVSALQEKVLHDPECMQRLLTTISINVTEFFRDPEFFLAFREKVVPGMRAFPLVRIWDVGCSTGEEAYSLAILLEEEEVYDRVRLYATDMNEGALQSARIGVFAMCEPCHFVENHRQAGGREPFAGYYAVRQGKMIFHPRLRRNIVWGVHNLATDGSFNEFHVICCRNVMIYFGYGLQRRVHQLLYESLAPAGVLVLGKKESLKFTALEDRYEVVDGENKIYRKVR